MTTNIDISQRLKDLRKQFDKTQQKVADSIGIKRSLYGAYEEGRAKPGIETLLALCEYYGFTSLNELIGISGIKEKEHSDLLTAYFKASPDKRKLVNFILKLES